MNHKEKLDYESHLVTVGLIAKLFVEKANRTGRMAKVTPGEGIETLLEIYPSGSLNGIKPGISRPEQHIKIIYHNNKGNYEIKFTDPEGHRMDAPEWLK